MPYDNRQHNDASYGGGYDPNRQAIPRAPRTPHFAPQMVAAPMTGRGYQAGPGSSRDRVPAAPHSLSPVALASARGAVATGGYQAQDTQEVKARPSSKAGMAILITGAIIGGLIGAVMHVRDTTADAFAQAAMVREHDTTKSDRIEPPTGGAVALPPMIPALPGNLGAPILNANDKIAADKLGTDKAVTEKTGADKTGKFKGKIGGSKHSTVASVDKSAQNAIDSDKAEAKPEPTSKKKKSKDDDGYTVASAGSDGETASKPEPKAKPEKAEPKADKKSADKADKSADAPAPKKKPKSDEVDVLKAAMGATENTL